MMSVIYALNQQSSQVLQSTLSFLFDKAVGRDTGYLSQQQQEQKQCYVRSLEKLESELQYCMVSEINNGPGWYNAHWKIYFEKWFNKLASDVALWIVNASDPTSFEDLEAHVNKRSGAFIRVMLGGRVTYSKVSFCLMP